MTKKVPPNKNVKFIPRNFASEIKALVMDFDGVLTDNKVIVNEDGSESVTCSRDDGYAIEKIKELGIITLILTREKNNVVIARAKKLNTEIIKGEKEKLEKLKKWCLKNNIFPEGLAYIGNDLPDIGCLEYAKFSFCPADAFGTVRKKAEFILNKKGGDGCIREILEDYILAN